MSGHFLQSKAWEDFQKSLGRKVFRVGGVLVTKLPLVFGKNYFYSAGSELPVSIYEIKSIGGKEGAVFLKCEPLANRTGSDPVRLGFVKSNKEVQPQKTVILDITKSERELLGNMHQKARYNIGVAEKHGVNFSLREVSRRETIFPLAGDPRQGDKFQILEKFWELMQKTARRDKFSSHTRGYYEKLLELPMVNLFTTEYQGKVVSANIVLFYGDTAYYLHGASDYEYRATMAPHLLHWRTIKHAKERGYKAYDFWGIDEKKWPGITRFKKGFGGQEVEYIGSYDYVFQPFWYKIYGLYQKLKVKS